MVSIIKKLITEAFLPQTIKEQIRKEKSIVHGAQSINAQVLPFLRRPTTDYDLFETNPLLSARRLERKLDKQAGGDVYIVRPAMHKGTYKVVNKESGKVVADYTSTKGQNLNTNRINQINYTTLDFEARKKRMILSQKMFMFRHKKAREDLERIRLHRFLSQK